MLMDSISAKNMPEKNVVGATNSVRPIKLPDDAPRLKREQTKPEDIVSELVDHIRLKYNVMPTGLEAGDDVRIRARSLTLKRHVFRNMPPGKKIMIFFSADEKDYTANEKDRKDMVARNRIVIEKQDGVQIPYPWDVRTVFVLDVDDVLSIGMPADGVPSAEDVYHDTVNIMIVILDKRVTK